MNGQPCEVALRAARESDLGAINAIYNHYVLHSTCTYQLEEDTSQDRAKWFAAHGAPHPMIVAERDGQVVGWGSLSQFHTRCAYARTVENSVYVRHDLLGRGIGSAILEQLIHLAAELGHHTIVALISADQEASVRLHAKHGFVLAGRVREVGCKFDRWLDVVYMQRML